jgi:transposase
VNSKVHYENSFKAHDVYLSQYKLLPYKRAEKYFIDSSSILTSSAALVMFNQQASQLLKQTAATGKI